LEFVEAGEPGLANLDRTCEIQVFVTSIFPYFATLYPGYTGLDFHFLKDARQTNAFGLVEHRSSENLLLASWF
jgi:hypothetical protein